MVEAENNGRRNRQKGHAVLEVSLLAPWIFLLFAGVFDFGFYAYALICTQNAARAAALYATLQPHTPPEDPNPCLLALGELNALPNARNLKPPCPTELRSGYPMAVRVVPVAAGVDGRPAARAVVSYQTIRLIPLPFMANQMTFTRAVEVRIREE